MLRPSRHSLEELLAFQDLLPASQELEEARPELLIGHVSFEFKIKQSLYYFENSFCASLCFFNRAAYSLNMNMSVCILCLGVDVLLMKIGGFHLKNCSIG